MDTETNAPLDGVSRFLHLGLAVFGVWAWLVGSGWIGAGAGDYKKPDHFWYTQHMWVGITFTAFLLARILWGFVGPESAKFRNWVPWNAALFKPVVEDLRTLLRFRIPDRPSHVGLSGLVQALGLLVFLWIGLTGLVNAFTITPGEKLLGWAHEVKELHETADVLVPAYLILHVGGALLHSLTGRPVWRKMLFLE
ncbi:MAG TPA: cytochrome b/b6 domain-containing protein [Gammaproteobacteria bacterium]|nr:cytochrome b/b6 domain-containing protein [Gammaproteobacteria bacterium]